jgi:hypothetical protein
MGTRTPCRPSTYILRLFGYAFSKEISSRGARLDGVRLLSFDGEDIFDLLLEGVVRQQNKKTTRKGGFA